MKVKDIRGEMGQRARKAAGRVETLYAKGKERVSHVEFRPLWERMKTGFGKTATVIGKGTERAAENVVVTARRAGIRYELFDLHHKLQKLVAQLGATVYDGRKKGAKSISYSASPIKDLIMKIADLEKRIDGLERRSRGLKKAA